MGKNCGKKPMLGSVQLLLNPKCFARGSVRHRYKCAREPNLTLKHKSETNMKPTTNFLMQIKKKVLDHFSDGFKMNKCSGLSTAKSPSVCGEVSQHFNLCVFTWRGIISAFI